VVLAGDVKILHQKDQEKVDSKVMDQQQQQHQVQPPNLNQQVELQVGGTTVV